MTRNGRIVLNIIATYGRSLVAMFLGLFTARWILMALGKSDFGLYGVVGGLAVFIGIFNHLLAIAVARFYAVSIGEAKRFASAEEGLEHCRQWFNTALLVHTVIPVTLIAIGYPIGIWAIENFLTIPVDRICDCRWVFRCVCFTTFVGMVSVPFSAMYGAKQYIAELTVYSLAQTVLTFCFVYYMVEHPGTWLVGYAAGVMIIAVIPQMLIAARAFCAFPECKIRLAYCWSVSRLKKLGYYAVWQVFGGLGAVLRAQGLAIVINKYFGASVNASMTLANQVSGQTITLVASLQGAFQPAVATAYGEGDLDRVHKLSYAACKFGLLMMLLFIIPLTFELQEVLRIWLKTPPPYTTGLCICVLIMLLVDKSALGQMLAVQAKGKIALYQAVLGGCIVLTLPVAWGAVALGYGVYSVGISMVFTMMLCAWGRVIFAHFLVGMSARIWLFKVMLPVISVSIVSCVAAYVPRLFMSSCFLRVCITTIFAESVFLPLSWFFVLNREERSYASNRIRRLFARG